ncbi:uncharacterized protein LOC107268128 [Cephus cinctus]|uniref:Uncharacterized protein LOC107268128 n=1 Tax=Cephus cinctus TaxID=211228 RepID=A0AAJ7FKE0_CEPCN|nr:uncharacterized protein LOC107268128 [Cephus cinctus]
MEALWNKLNLERPPNNTCSILSHKFDSNAFSRILDNAIKDLDSQDILHKEAAILSRLIYRFKSKFRSDKGLKNMEKLNRALLNYLNLALGTEYKHLRDCIEHNGKTVSLPTRQMVEYVLVKTQGFSKLMVRVEEVATQAAKFFKTRIGLGQAWVMSVIGYAVISRIWMLSRHMVKRCCEWYNNVYYYLNKIPSIGVPWIPNNYKLPSNLTVWIAVPWITEEIKSVPMHEKGAETIFNLITPQNDDAEVDLIFDVDDLDQIAKPTNCLHATMFNKRIDERAVHEEIKIDHSLSLMDDIGKPIDRHAFESVCIKDKNTLESNPMKSVNKTKKILKKQKRSLVSKKEKTIQIMKEDTPPKIKEIVTETDLIDYLKRDSYPGLDKLQYNIFKKTLRMYLIRIKKCERSDEKKRIRLLSRINQIVQVSLN